MQALWNRLRTKLFNNEEELFEHPEDPQQEETRHTIETLTLQEQIQIFQKVDQYMKEYTPQYASHVEEYEKGFTMKNELFVTEGDEPVSRCNIEVFYQKKGTTEKVVSYLVSLIKFGDEEWRVFHVK